MAFASRLVADLRLRAQLNVWWDEKAIRAGARFDIRIENGIRDSDVLATVISRRALEDDCICRDELAFAILHAKPILPLRLQPVVPGLLLARRSWIDFSSDYEDGIRRLLAFVNGDHSVLVDPIDSVSGVAPLDFGPELARHSTGRIERTWLLERVTLWMKSAGDSLLIVSGPPGWGKSSFAATMAVGNALNVVAIHFCAQSNPASLRAMRFVASIVGQLQMRVPGFADAVRDAEPAVARHSALDAFRQLVIEPAHRLPQQTTAALIVIDALDQAPDGRDSIQSCLRHHHGDLPGWLRILVTARPEPGLLEHFPRRSLIDLARDTALNQADVARVISTHWSTLDAATRAGIGMPFEELEHRISRMASGNLLIARMMLSEPDLLRRAQADTGLAGTIGSFYADAFASRFGEGFDAGTPASNLLAALAASQDRLPMAILFQIAGADKAAATRTIRALRPFLVVIGDGENASYELFHASLGEWLADPAAAGRFFVDVTNGHQLLARCGLHQHASPTLSPYFKAHLPLHLARAGMIGELKQLTMSGPWRLFSRWTEAGETEVGVECLSALLASPEIDAQFKAGLATQVARIHTLRGDYAQSEASLERARRATSWWNGRRIRAVALHELGSLALYRYDYATAEACYKAALRHCRYGWPVFHDELSANLGALATLHLDHGRGEQARALAAKATRAARRGRDSSHFVAAFRLMAAASKTLGQYERAREEIELGLRLAETLGLPIEKTRLLILGAWAEYDEALRRRRVEVPATPMIEQALTCATAARNLFSACEVRLSLGWFAMAGGNIAAARDWYDATSRMLPPDHLPAFHAGVAVGRAALLHHARTDPTAAYATAIDYCERNRLFTWLARARTGLGTWHWQTGDHERAAVEWQEAIGAAASVNADRRLLTEQAIALGRERPTETTR